MIFIGQPCTLTSVLFGYSVPVEQISSKGIIKVNRCHSLCD